MVPTAKGILFSTTNYHFPGKSIQDLKAVNQVKCEKGYHI